MGFKFQPGDRVYIVDENPMHGWIKPPAGTRGTVLRCEYDVERNQVFVQLQLQNHDGMPFPWLFLESALDFVNPPRPVDVSSLL